MSRFGRIDADDKLDRYYTPEWATRALVDYLGGVNGATIVEPCAGMGHIVDVLADAGAVPVAGDIDMKSPYHRRDYDATDPECLSNHYDIDHIAGVITNPPYSADSGSAAEVIEACQQGLDTHVWALVRLSFLEPTANREDLLQRMSKCLLLPRVDYSGPALDGTSSAGETSCWCHWRPDLGTDYCVTRWISREKRDELKGQESIFD